MSKAKRVQVVLPDTLDKRLQAVILRESVRRGKVMSVSEYLRDMIVEHIAAAEKTPVNV